MSIVQYVRNGNNAGNFASTIDYIEGRSSNKEHSVTYRSAQNVFSLETVAEYMQLVASRGKARGNFNPRCHIVFSVAPGEQISNDDADAAVKIILHEIGADTAQAYWATHVDKDSHQHVHLCINKVDPFDFHTLNPPHRYYRDALQRAAALIDHQQGRQSAEHAWYRVNDRGELERTGSECMDKSISRGAKAREIYSGYKSYESLAQERIESLGNVFTQAHSWQEINTKLAGVGLILEPKSGGAVFRFHNNQAVKFSKVVNNTKFSEIVERLGEFQAHKGDIAQIDIAERVETTQTQTTQLKDVVRGLVKDFLFNSSDWKTLHTGLALNGIELQKAGSGAKLCFNGGADILPLSEVMPDLKFKDITSRIGKWRSRTQCKVALSDVQITIPDDKFVQDSQKGILSESIVSFGRQTQIGEVESKEKRDTQPTTVVEWPDKASDLENAEEENDVKERYRVPSAKITPVLQVEEPKCMAWRKRKKSRFSRQRLGDVFYNKATEEGGIYKAFICELEKECLGRNDHEGHKITLDSVYSEVKDIVGIIFNYVKDRLDKTHNRQSVTMERNNAVQNMNGGKEPECTAFWGDNESPKKIGTRLYELYERSGEEFRTFYVELERRVIGAGLALSDPLTRAEKKFIDALWHDVDEAFAKSLPEPKFVAWKQEKDQERKPHGIMETVLSTFDGDQPDCVGDILYQEYCVYKKEHGEARAKQFFVRYEAHCFERGLRLGDECRPSSDERIPSYREYMVREYTKTEMEMESQPLEFPVQFSKTESVTTPVKEHTTKEQKRGKSDKKEIQKTRSMSDVEKNHHDVEQKLYKLGFQKGDLVAYKFNDSSLGGYIARFKEIVTEEFLDGTTKTGIILTGEEHVSFFCDAALGTFELATERQQANVQARGESPQQKQRDRGR